MPKYLHLDVTTTATLATPATTAAASRGPYGAWRHTKIADAQTARMRGDAAAAESAELAALDHRRELVLGRTAEVDDGDVVVIGAIAYAVRVAYKGARFDRLELVKLGRDPRVAVVEAATMFATTGRIAAARALAEARCAHMMAMSGSGINGSTAPTWKTEELARLIKSQDDAMGEALEDTNRWADRARVPCRTVAIVACAADANPFDEAKRETLNNRAGWLQISEAQYDSARGVLPPISIEGGGWAMGEMYDLHRGWVFACVDIGTEGPPSYGFFCRLMRIDEAPEAIIDLRLALPHLTA